MADLIWLYDNRAMKYIKQCVSGRYSLRNSLSAILPGQRGYNSKTTIILCLKKKMFTSYKIKPKYFMEIVTWSWVHHIITQRAFGK